MFASAPRRVFLRRACRLLAACDANLAKPRSILSVRVRLRAKILHSAVRSSVDQRPTMYDSAAPSVPLKATSVQKAGSWTVTTARSSEPEP